MNNEEIKHLIESEVSGIFTRGELSEHDAKIVQKWIEKFVELHESQGEDDASG